MLCGFLGANLIKLKLDRGLSNVFGRCAKRKQLAHALRVPHKRSTRALLIQLFHIWGRIRAQASKVEDM